MPRFLISAVLLSSLFLPVAALGQGVISTVAGSGWNFFSVFSSPGAALSAPLGGVTGVAVDAAGNVFASDAENNLVAKISTGGVLVVVAGNGQPGLSGEGIAAAGASLNRPLGVAVDRAGNLYILESTDSFGQAARIRKVDAAGIIRTVADGGLSRPQGLAADAQGNLYVADTGNARIRRISADGTIQTVAGNGACAFAGDGGAAVDASLCEPYAVAVDVTGTFYVSDLGNSRIRKVTAEGRISTVAGNGVRGYAGDGGSATQASLSWPYGLAVDGAGNLYVADMMNHRIRRVSAAGTITSVAGNSTANFLGDGGPAAAAALNTPQGVAVSAAGDLFIADTRNSRVRKIAQGAAGAIITTVAGNGRFKVAGDGGAATAASLNNPSALVADRAGNLFIAERFSHRVRKMSPNGIITTYAGRGLGFAGDGGPAAEALLNSPAGLALDSAGNLYIADSGNNRVRRVSADGKIETVAGGGPSGFLGDGGPAREASLNFPSGVAVDSAGNLFIAEALNQRVRKVGPDGVIRTFPERGFFNFPLAVAVDSLGNLYVAVGALSMARRDGGVTKVGPDGTVSSAVGSLIRPTGVAVDSASHLYVSDAFDNVVLKAVPGGTPVRVAGTGQPGFSGDGGPATGAALQNPAGLAVDAAGLLYVADSGNDRVRKVAGAGCEGLAEPKLSVTLQPGFYIGEVRNAPGTREGYWGMEVLVEKGALAGGFNLGGAALENGGPPAFGAFYVPGTQKVSVRVDAQVLPGGDPGRFSMSVRLLDSNRQQIGTEQLGTAFVQFERTLSEGFYIMEVRTGSSAPRATFQMGLGADAFGGGVNVGGFVSDGLVGFGAFYVPEAQDVKISLLGPSYDRDGAGCVRLTLLDANRRVIRTAP